MSINKKPQNKALNDLDPSDRDLNTQELIKKVLKKLR